MRSLSGNENAGRAFGTYGLAFVLNTVLLLAYNVLLASSVNWASLCLVLPTLALGLWYRLGKKYGKF